MKKIFLNLILLLILFTDGAHSQVFVPSKVQSEIKIFSNKDSLNEFKNSTIEFLINKKTKKNEVKFTINRLVKKGTLRYTESYDTDTVRYDGEKYTVDTDDPVPKGEHQQSLLENMVKFTNKTLSLQESEVGIFELPKLKAGTPNIPLYYMSQLPMLNKNAVFSPLLLNFSPMLASKIDTLISETYNGVFVTNYIKTSDGYDISGKLIPLKTSKSETDPNLAFEIYEYFNYSGNLKTNNEKIEVLILNIQEKSSTVANKKVLFENKDRKYKVVVKNTKIE